MACGAEEGPAFADCELPPRLELLSLPIAHLLEWNGSATIAGRYAVVNTSGYVDAEPLRSESSSYAVDLCDASTLELAAPGRPTTDFGGAASWIVAIDEDDARVRWVDPEGAAPSRVLFESPDSCLARVADGLATIASDGTLWFHADPGDPDVGAQAIAHGIRSPSTSGLSQRDTTCRSPELPRVEGDGLLVLEDAGPLVWIGVPDGAREVVIDAEVEDAVVLDDPRYVLWYGREHDVDACCDSFVRDRQTGDQVWLGPGIAKRYRNLTAHWIAMHSSEPSVFATTFVDVRTGGTALLEEEWGLEGELVDGRLLVRRGGAARDARLFDPTTGDLQVVDLPPWSIADPAFPDGVLGMEWIPPSTSVLKFLRFADGEVESVARVDSDYHRLRDGTLLFKEVEEGDVAGALVMLRDGQREVIDEGVHGFAVPFHGTERERNEVMYWRATSTHATLWRHVLP